MAVPACLVALASKVDLQSLEPGTAKRGAVLDKLLFEAVHVTPERNSEGENAKHQKTTGPIVLRNHDSSIEFFRVSCHARDVPKERLIIFVKAPRPGSVKTRIAKTAGAERACQMYRELVESLLENVRSLPDVELRFTPDDAQDEVQSWLRGNWFVRPQGPGDLGERLHRAFADAFAGGAERVTIIGSDCPEVSARDVRHGWKELKAHDLVVGPALDGGYWLIGLRAPQPELFRNISWSSDQVLGQTLACAKALGLRIQLLRILADIDTEEDWNAYVRERDPS